MQSREETAVAFQSSKRNSGDKHIFHLVRGEKARQPAGSEVGHPWKKNIGKEGGYQEKSSTAAGTRITAA